jgi:hypothetical protein
MSTRLSVQAKLVIVSVLLALALGITAFFASETLQAFQEFQQQHAFIMAGDVRSIRPWMTIPYIAHTYHVPESYLYQSLHIVYTQPPHHATLHSLAVRYNRSENELVRTLQNAIQDYRRQHPYQHKANLRGTTRFRPGGPIRKAESLQLKSHALAERMCR